MGWSKLNEKFVHVTESQALTFFASLFSLRMFVLIWWKQAIISEHIRFVYEATPGGMYFGRSLFRSTQEFTDPLEINAVQWYQYYAGKPDPKTGKFTMVASSPPMPLHDFMGLYADNKGKGNW